MHDASTDETFGSSVMKSTCMEIGSCPEDITYPQLTSKEEHFLKWNLLKGKVKGIITFQNIKKLFKKLGNIKKTTVIAAQLECVHEIKKETRKLQEKACMVNDQNHSSYKRLEDFLYKGDSLSKC